MTGNHPSRRAGADRFAPCVRPRPSWIVAAQAKVGWTDARCAEACCVPEATWVGWKSGQMAMPAGAWKLFRIEAGLLKL